MFNSEQMIDIGGGYNQFFFTQKVDVSICSVNYLQKHDISIHKNILLYLLERNPSDAYTCNMYNTSDVMIIEIYLKSET